ncbi:MAG: dephospho-CoA kinase [Fusobacteriaceae bacterium]
MIMGLTGGIASGKSTASRILKEIGYKIYDADIIAHEALKQESCKKKIKKEFGEIVFDKTGEVNRKILREIAFSDKDNLRKLNSIVHPIVIKEFEKIKENSVSEKIIIFDIPLLFEAKLEYLCDKIVLIYTKREIQIKRVIERDKNSQDLAEKIIDSQESLENKKLKSDYCIENSKNIFELKKELILLFEKIKKAD